MQYVVSLLFAAICYFIYSYVAVCMFCAVRCVIIICCYLLFYLQLCSCMYVLCSTLCHYYLLLFLFSNYSTRVFYNTPFMFAPVLYFVLLFRVFCVLVSFCVLFHLLHCLFPITVQVKLLLRSGGNPIAVNKYQIKMIIFPHTHTNSYSPIVITMRMSPP